MLKDIYCFITHFGSFDTMTDLRQNSDSVLADVDLPPLHYQRKLFPPAVIPVEINSQPDLQWNGLAISLLI